MNIKLNRNSEPSPFDRLKDAESLPDSRKEEFKSYAIEYLQSKNWKIRNVGVKLIGILKFKEMIPDLLIMLTDKTPDTFLNRLLGGDFVQVGFIRRNCIRSLIVLQESNNEIKEAIYKALSDPYWEVRAEAVLAVIKLLLKEDLKDIEESLMKLLDDRKFEVLVRSIEALGLVSKNKEILKSFRRLYYHPNNKVKCMLIKALHNLFKRGVISTEEELTNELNQIFVPVINY